jgi:hypothetical protein
LQLIGCGPLVNSVRDNALAAMRTTTGCENAVRSGEALLAAWEEENGEQDDRARIATGVSESG